MENYKNSKIGRETAQKYGDILEMERPQTEESLRKHPRMTLQNRAKIFSPFSPLRGYDEQLAAEKQRTERVAKRILTEEEISALSDRLMQVTKGMTITVRYFKEDTAHPEVPAVGNYITLTGKADRIDPVFRTLQVGDIVVPFEDLVEVSGEGIMDINAYLGTGLFCQQLFRDVGERQEERFRLSASVSMPWLRLGRKYSIMVTEIPWVSEHEKRRHCGRKRGNEYESA